MQHTTSSNVGSSNVGSSSTTTSNSTFLEDKIEARRIARDLLRCVEASVIVALTGEVGPSPVKQEPQLPSAEAELTERAGGRYR